MNRSGGAMKPVILAVMALIASTGAIYNGEAPKRGCGGSVLVHEDYSACMDDASTRGEECEREDDERLMQEACQ